MATDVERTEGETSSSDQMESLLADEIGEEALSFGERFLIAQQIESVRKDQRRDNQIIHDRMGRMESRLGEMIAANAAAIANNAAAIAAAGKAIKDLSAKLSDVRVGIKDDVIAAYKEERTRSDTRKGWLMMLLAAFIGSGATVGLTILAARFGLMSF